MFLECILGKAIQNDLMQGTAQMGAGGYGVSFTLARDEPEFGKGGRGVKTSDDRHYRVG